MEELTEKNDVKPAIDRVYSFTEVDEAFKQLESGQSSGKIIVKVKD